MVIAVGKPENTMKRRKALQSEEELFVRKERNRVRKASKRASETRKQTLHRQEQNQTHITSMRTLNRLCTGKNRTEHIVLHILI